jgi:hypothetical protein
MKARSRASNQSPQSGRRAHRVGSIESIGRNAGAQHGEAVERGFRRDRGVIAREPQLGVGDGDMEVLGDFATVPHGADLEADIGGAAQRGPPARDARLNVPEVLLGGIKQFVIRLDEVSAVAVVQVVSP